MKTLFVTFASTLALALSVPAVAQDITTTADNPEKTAIAPARLAAAQTTVDHLFPLGTYERMMKGTMDQIMDSIMGQMFERPVAETLKSYGIEDEELDAMGDTSFNELMKEKDPHFEERMKISTRVMMDEMVKLMTAMEPEIRTALTKIYARKFTVQQLTEMNAFFATNTGSIFARDYMMVFVDPEMMQSMMSMVPEMMQSMPDIMKKVEDATKHLPPVTTGEDEELDVHADPDSAEAA